MNWKFWKRKKPSEISLETIASWPSKLLKSSELKVLTGLAHQQKQLEDAKLVKEQLADLASILQKVASNGRYQAKVIIYDFSYYDNLFKLQPLVDINTYYKQITPEGLAFAVKYFTEELRSLGYEVTARPVNINITRVQGDVQARHLGTELTIAWLI